MPLLFPLLLLIPSVAPVRDAAHGFSFTPPDGYVEAREAAPDALHAWSTGELGSERFALFTVTGLGGRLAEGSSLDRAVVEKSAREAAARSGVTMKRFDYRTTQWRGVPLDVVVSWASGNGQELVSFAAQLPLEPEALQVVMFGPADTEQQLDRDLKALLGSVEGKVSWAPKPNRDRALGRALGLPAGIGVGVALGLLARRFFRRRA